MFKFINLKEGNPTVDYAVAVMEIEIEKARLENVSAIKVLHGYGSHGKGGAILVALRARLHNYFGGDKWNLFDADAMEVLSKDKSIFDEDLGKSNPGITIICM